MILEEKIDAVRNRAVGWVVWLLQWMGASQSALTLYANNSRFECPVCRFIRAMRQRGISVSQKWSAFCTECRALPRQISKKVWHCLYCQIRGFGLKLTPMLLHSQYHLWISQKVPIYLQIKVLRI